MFFCLHNFVVNSAKHKILTKLFLILQCLQNFCENKIITKIIHEKFAKFKIILPKVLQTNNNKFAEKNYAKSRNFKNLAQVMDTGCLDGFNT